MSKTKLTRSRPRPLTLLKLGRGVNWTNVVGTLGDKIELVDKEDVHEECPTIYMTKKIY